MRDEGAIGRPVHAARACTRPGLAGLVLLVAAALVGLAAASPARTRTLTVRSSLNSALGATILVDSAGFPLYHDLHENTKGKIHCVGTCAQEWLPLLVGRQTRVVAGPGVSQSELGTVRRPNGTIQVTYNGLPLYRFSGDTIPGQAIGQGAHHVWFAVTAAGVITRAGVVDAGGPDTGYSY